jgi:hypothetical protein
MLYPIRMVVHPNRALGVLSKDVLLVVNLEEALYWSRVLCVHVEVI